ncbi:hypothetical protein Pmar_PMAR027592, partial [Perkinsus marinus ATCC 50983]
ELERCWRFLQTFPQGEFDELQEIRANLKVFYGHEFQVILNLTPDALLPAMLHPVTKVRGVEKLEMVVEFRRRVRIEQSILR